MNIQELQIDWARKEIPPKTIINTTNALNRQNIKSSKEMVRSHINQNTKYTKQGKNIKSSKVNKSSKI